MWQILFTALYIAAFLTISSKVGQHFWGPVIGSLCCLPLRLPPQLPPLLRGCDTDWGCGTRWLISDSSVVGLLSGTGRLWFGFEWAASRALFSSKARALFRIGASEKKLIIKTQGTCKYNKKVCAILKKTSSFLEKDTGWHHPIELLSHLLFCSQVLKKIVDNNKLIYLQLFGTGLNFRSSHNWHFTCGWWCNWLEKWCLFPWCISKAVYSQT